MTIPARPTDLPDPETATAGSLAAAMASGATTARTLLDTYLARIEVVDRRVPALNAVRRLNPAAPAEAAASDARRSAGRGLGPLDGVPVLVKDNVDLAGLPTTAGALALERSLPPDDAPLASRLRGAGAVLLGKANLTEMANFLTEGMPSGYSSLGGQVLNPYDTSVTPSGSSAGSAAAVAAGLAPLAVGSETNGSILSPADHCGIVGIKPTVGLVSRTGMVPISPSQDTAGPMATDVLGAAWLLAALAGPDPEDPATAGAPSDLLAALAGLLDADGGREALGATRLAGARLGVVDAPRAPGGEAAWRATVDALRSQGAELVAVTVPPTPPPHTVLVHEFAPALDAYLARLGPAAPIRSSRALLEWNAAHDGPALKFGQTLLERACALDHADPDTAAAYREARRADLAATRDLVDLLLREHRLTALVWPGAGSADVGARAGYPSVAVPAGLTHPGRRPTGVTILGPAWSELTLLGLAADLQAALPARRPPSAVNPAAFRRA